MCIIDNRLMNYILNFFYFHSRISEMKLLHETCECNVFIIDYRGFGRSKGRPSEQGEQVGIGEGILNDLSINYISANAN